MIKPSVATVLAFDFGLQRIGVAVGQSVSASATPLTTLYTVDNQALWQQIDALIETWRPDRLLLGRPQQRDDAKALEQGLESFAAGLENREAPLEWVDESGSSIEARRRLKNQRGTGQRGRIRKTDIDAEAARIIAERWLQTHDPDRLA